MKQDACNRREMRWGDAYDVSDISLAVNGVPSKGIAQRLQIAGELQWNEPKDAKRIGSATITMPGVDSVQVMLSLSTRYVRRHWFVDPIRSRNERYLSMRLFDSNLKMVRRYLFDETNADKFELSVAALLYLSGFNPAVQVETDSPDILVSTPSGQLALVECTLKIADVERKIGKLVDRREALTKALSTEGRVVQVLSVLVCQSDRAQIAATDRELAMKGILLFSKEDLARQVETRLHAPINPDIQYQELIDRLKQFSALP